MSDLLTYVTSLDIQSIVSWLLMIIGSFFILTGAMGIIRFPDFYSRMHPSGLIDSAGAPLVLAGIAVDYGLSLITFKIILLIVILMFTGSTSTHTLAKAAMLSGLKPLGKIEEMDSSKT
ncbi:MAG: monovalent cation/H(+) antiporter subunit G [Rickettsiales bacterium]|nr:monovalent cation/H(+) antiporter subunit G [Rickettsiales bacterium]